MPGFLSVREQNTKNVRKGLQGSAFVALSTAAAPTLASLFASDGSLTGVPAAYEDVGILSDAGAKFARSIKTSDITGWGYTEPVRSDITSDVSTLVIECEETKLATIGLFVGVDPSTITPDPTSGAIAVPKPSIGNPLTYRVLVLAADEGSTGEFIIARFYPNAKVTDIGDQSFANGDSPITWPVTFTAYTDSVLGYSACDFIGGPGWLAQLGAEDVPRTVTCTTATSTALVATTGTFTAYDVGRHVSGAGIPANDTISAFTDSTHVTLANATTASATGVAVTIT